MSSDPPCPTCGGAESKFLAELLGARCSHEPSRPCSHLASVFFVEHHGDYGTGPGISFTGACARHRARVGRVVLDHVRDQSWLGVSEVERSDLPEMLSWFHERSGLCSTHHLCVATAGGF